MSELTFRSAGVSTREIDQSAPTAVTPSGIPAAVIGTTQRGPAFVPVTVATFNDFVAKFGPTDGQKFGPLAMREWLRNAGSGVYVKLLGAGDGTQRTSTGDNAGKVNRAGFVVGERLPQTNGSLGANTKATGGLPEGRTYFLGSFMSESNGSTVLSSAGIQTGASAAAVIRGVILAASGVFPSLSAVGATNTVGTSTINGFQTGTVDPDNRDSFVMLLNGHVNTSTNPNVITASFDPTAPNYFGEVLNKDPYSLEDAGYYLYANYDIRSALAVVTGSGITGDTAAEQKEVAFLLSGSQARNTGDSTHPNYESFEDRFRTAFSPFIISQKFGGKPKNLFKVHALDDGEYPNERIKISIENISKSRDAKSPYGTFDLLVRRFNDTDFNPVVLERFSRLSLDPNSDRYIARVIGDRHTFFDFDKRTSSQRLVVDGSYPNQSRFIRVQMDPEVDDASIDATALPIGFRGPYHLVTSGSGFLGVEGIAATPKAALSASIQPPIPYRETVALGTGLKKRASNALYWGVQSEIKDSVTDPNRSTTFDESLGSFTRYFPNYHINDLSPWVGDNTDAANVNGSVVDADLFNNNLFSLENVAVVTGSDGLADATQWLSASYVRDGSTAPSGRRFLDASRDLGSIPNRPFIKFTTIVQGGFDGVNKFVRDKAEFDDVAVKNEIADTAQGNTDGPTVQAYRKAVTILGAKANADIQLLAIPGIRQPAITDFTIQEIEERFDAMYIMDIPAYDTQNTEVTGSTQEVSVTYTSQNFTNRSLDSSFAAAYFPDVVMTDAANNTNLVVPASVPVLGAFSLNDSVRFPWFAPAGFTGGALPTTLESTVKFNRANLDSLQDADINPIVAFPGRSPVVFGQKTLLQAQSALDRVNVRRLLIDIRRQVRAVGDRFLFEPNREENLARFQRAVSPILATVQAQRGVKDYQVIIDTTTTTQTDIENNTIRGKIILQPTRSLEFVALDFVVTNAGTEA